MVKNDTETFTVDQVLRQAVRQMIAQFDPLRIVLFGSYARGDYTADSDLDFLVVMPDGTDRRQSAIELHRCLRDLAMPKDVLVTTPREIQDRGSVNGTVLAESLRQGKVLYERS